MAKYTKYNDFHMNSMDISLYSPEMAHVMIQLISAYEVEVTASLRALNPAKASYYDSSHLIHTIIWTKAPLITKFNWTDTPQGFDYWKDIYLKNLEYYEKNSIFIEFPYETIKLGEETFNI